MSTGGFIYFLRTHHSGRVKIGFSRDPDSRVRSIQTAAPEPLALLAILPGTEQHEQSLHSAFAHRRVHGEWFEDCDEIRSVFELRLPTTRPTGVREELMLGLADARDELLQAQLAIARNDVDEALTCFDRLTDRLTQLVTDLKSNEPAAHLGVGAAGSSTNGG